LWLHSLKVAQLLRSAACLHTNQSRSYLNHLVATATKDMWVANLVEPWRGDSNRVPVVDFFNPLTEQPKWDDWVQKINFG